jgi:hypothetical protein
MADPKIKWRGIDGAGYAYGFLQDGATQHRVDIAIPGRGVEPHPGPDFSVYVDGEKIGAKSSLGEAASHAERYFRDGRHRAGKHSLGAEAHPARERRSLKQVLSDYVGVKPRGRGR